MDTGKRMDQGMGPAEAALLLPIVERVTRESIGQPFEIMALRIGAEALKVPELRALIDWIMSQAPRSN